MATPILNRASRLAYSLPLLCMIAAAPCAGQGPEQKARERYDRQTKGASIDEFVRRLNGDDPEKRLQAVKSLEESKDLKAVEYLVQALGDSDVRIRAKAIDALGNLRAREASPVLIQQLVLRNVEPSVKQRLLASLGKIGDERSAAAIMEFMQRDLDPATRGTAIFALGDIGAAIASGSFPAHGMLVAPCSIKSLSAVANSYAADLLSRAADVTLKEGRPLLLVVRETPLHRGHLRLMMRAAEAGAVIFPPAPAFYSRPQTVDDMVDNLVGRMLARIGIENAHYARWTGLESKDPARWPPADYLALPAMTLATTGADGSPHAAAVYFAADEQNRFYFFSEADSQHTLDVSANPRAATAAARAGSRGARAGRARAGRRTPPRRPSRSRRADARRPRR